MRFYVAMDLALNDTADGYKASYCDRKETADPETGKLCTDPACCISSFVGGLADEQPYSLGEFWNDLAFVPQEDQTQLKFLGFHNTSEAAVWDGESWTQWTAEHWEVPLTIAAVYLASIYTIKAWMVSRGA